MTDLATMLSSDRLVDLTQPLGPGTSLWPAPTPFRTTTVAHYDTSPGYARELEARVGVIVDGSGAPARVFAILPSDA